MTHEFSENNQENEKGDEKVDSGLNETDFSETSSESPPLEFNSEELEKELEEWKRKALYYAAEKDNLIKRTEREKEQVRKYGQESLLKDLVEVVDNLERTITALKKTKQDENTGNFLNGINMVQSQFLEKLKGAGLEQVKSLGEVFDPNFHEAIGQEKAPEKQQMEIVQTFENGYLLNGRLLRAAKVIVINNE